MILPAGLPPLPTGGVSPQDMKRFDDYADAVLMEWVARKNARPTRRAESPNAWFKRAAYAFLLHYIDQGRTSIFHRFVRKDRRSSSAIEEALKNPFKLGLLAMCSDDSILSRNDRRVFGNQMLYAWLHRVPPVFLNAFLAVSGGPAEIAKKLKLGKPEPGFEELFDDARA